MKLIAAIPEEQDLDRIQPLLEQAGIQVTPKPSSQSRVYLCKKDQAEATVVVLSKKYLWDEILSGPYPGAGPLRAKVAQDIKNGQRPDTYQAWIFAKHGFFRWLFSGSKDRELQHAIAKALEPITYVRIDWRG